MLNAIVSRRGNQIKIEPNTVIRGGLLPAIEKPLSPYLVQRYRRAVSVSCLAKEELYAGKLCAALQRQHPRDLFDTWHFFQQHELTPEMMDVFVVYLISQGKPIYEALDPNLKEISALYHSQFVGMGKSEVALEHLLEIQNILPQYIVASLTTRHREFILGFKQGNPDWSFLPFTVTQHLPAVRWKQQNLDKIGSAKRQQALNKLQNLFESIPYNPQKFQSQIAREQPMTLPPQEQLAEEIAESLATSGLLQKSKQQQISQKIAAGQLKREDWLLLVELAQKPDLEEGRNDA